MENEKLRVFDENRNYIGIEKRGEVHRKGLWHEVFHCWIISEEEGAWSIWLQHRCLMKKDYADLLDITSAGHLLAEETVEDGVREIEEEIGLAVSFEELVPMGTIACTMKKEDMIDHEFAHLFLCEATKPSFTLQKEEVSGMGKVLLTDFEKLWNGETGSIRFQGFDLDEQGRRINVERLIAQSDFVPHEDSYYQYVARHIREYLAP